MEDKEFHTPANHHRVDSALMMEKSEFVEIDGLIERFRPKRQHLKQISRNSQGIQEVNGGM